MKYLENHKILKTLAKTFTHLYNRQRAIHKLGNSFKKILTPSPPA